VLLFGFPHLSARILPV